MTLLFLRDDDVGELTPALGRFVSILGERGLPVSYQMIPAGLTDECAGFLREAKAARPALVEFGQHGLRHEMRVGGRRVFYEFGPERSLAEQTRDIEEGRTILAERLGADWTNEVFTPPQHRYDRNTLRAVSQAGFKVLSAAFYPDLARQMAYRAASRLGLTNIGSKGASYHGRTRPDCGLYELSISVAADDGDNLTKSVEEIIARIALARRRTSAVGLMLHHEAYRRPGGTDHLERLADALAGLSGSSFHSIGDLYAASSARLASG